MAQADATAELAKRGSFRRAMDSPPAGAFHEELAPGAAIAREVSSLLVSGIPKMVSGLFWCPSTYQGGSPQKEQDTPVLGMLPAIFSEVSQPIRNSISLCISHWVSPTSDIFPTPTGAQHCLGFHGVGGYSLRKPSSHTPPASPQNPTPPPKSSKPWKPCFSWDRGDVRWGDLLSFPWNGGVGFLDETEHRGTKSEL